MRIQVSGIINEEEAWELIEGGVHALGFIFSPGQPRYLNPELAREIILHLPPMVSTVGVFINTPKYDIQELLTFCRLDWLQFIGQEKPAECSGYYQPIIKLLTQDLKAWIDYPVQAILANLELGQNSFDFKHVLPEINSKSYLVLNCAFSKSLVGELSVFKPYGVHFQLDQAGLINGYPIKEVLTDLRQISNS